MERSHWSSSTQIYMACIFDNGICQASCENIGP